MPALTTQRNFDLKEIVPLATAQQWPKKTTRRYLLHVMLTDLQSHCGDHHLILLTYWTCWKYSEKMCDKLKVATLLLFWSIYMVI